MFVVVPPQGRDQLRDKVVSNIAEVRARGTKTIVLAEGSDADARAAAEVFIELPEGLDAAATARRHRPPAADRLRAGDPARPRRRPAAEPREVGNGRVTRRRGSGPVGRDGGRRSHQSLG